jgi:hypothetical protein
LESRFLCRAYVILIDQLDTERCPVELTEHRMTSNAIWRGTEDELQRLAAALQQHCACTTDPGTESGQPCGEHAMLADERVLNHLLYVRRSWRRFHTAEARFAA